MSQSSVPTLKFAVQQAGRAARVVLLSAALALVCQQAAFADDEDVITYRQLIMKQLDAGASALGMMVSGQIPPDALATQSRALALNAKAALKSFEPKVQGGESKPEVWTKWADFSKRMDVFAKKSADMAKVAETGNPAANVAAVTELMVDALPCKECHNLYRNTKKK